MTDGLGESAGAASTEAREEAKECDRCGLWHVAVVCPFCGAKESAVSEEARDAAFKIDAAMQKAHGIECPLIDEEAIRLIEPIVEFAIRERERAALERAAKVAEGWHMVCVDIPSCDTRRAAVNIAGLIRALLGGE